MTQILNRWNGNVIVEGEMNLRELVLHAVNTGVSLNYASLDRASLDDASLDGASLDYASLNYASLDYASLNRASLDGASLNGASLDYSAWPLWCGSLTARVDNRIAAQLLFHAFAVARINPTEEQLTFIRNFYRFDECGGVERLVTK